MCIFLYIFASIFDAFASCTTSEIDVLGDGTSCEQSKFEITTTSATGNFKFNLSAQGTFYVDWGDGSAVQTIARTNTDATEYTHTYSSSGTYTIRFGGVATRYNTGASIPTIIFYKASGGTQTNIANISGSLGALFPTINNGENGYQPRFYETFMGATNMRIALYDTLFSGITGTPVSNMFAETFNGCSGITGSISKDLFSGMSGAPADNLFWDTFKDCSGLTGSIPADLFAGIVGTPKSRTYAGTFGGCIGLTGQIPAGLFRGLSGAPAPETFSWTFNGCSGLTGSIPAGLFGGLSGAPAKQLFQKTFYGCTGLTGSIPDTLFGNISGTPKENMFDETFYGCSGLTGQIPAGLFGGIYGAPAKAMFNNTFNGCSGLTGTNSANLFSRISGLAAESMFNGTFNGCTGISGFIPYDTFDNVVGTADNMMQNMFNNSGLATTCPSGYMQYITKFSSYYSGKAQCGLGATCATGYELRNDKCVLASECPTGQVYIDGECTTVTTNGTFSVMTTKTNVFSFSISAIGDFTIDWGDGSIQVINRTDTTPTTYSHTYDNSDIYTIGLDGLATGYSTNDTTAAISFNSNPNVAAISGSLGAIFPTIGNGGNGNQPRFYYAFRECTNLASQIPPNLFTGVHGAPVSYMFDDVFSGDSKLSGTIPAGLFSGISGAPAPEMFRGTFWNCTNLTGNIPSDLFDGISGAPATSMFDGTFGGCVGLTGFVPPNLFSGISSGTANNMMNYVFKDSGLATVCPSGYEQYITGFETYFTNRVSCVPELECTENQIKIERTCVDINPNDKFSVVTTNTNSFSFTISATGDFTID